MTLVIKPYGRSCELKNFSINGMGAAWGDFGEKTDRKPSNLEDWGCGDMQFTSRESSEEVLKKYKITEEEYKKICDELETTISVGSCGWCL